MTTRKSTTSIFLKPASGGVRAGVRPLQVAGLPKARFNASMRISNETALVKSLVDCISETAAVLADFQACGK